MSTSTASEQPKETWTQQAISLLLIAAGISFGVTFWSAVLALIVLLWLWLRA